VDFHCKTLALLAEIAESIPPVSNAKLAAALVHRKQLLSIGINRKKSHPFQAKYSSHKERIFFHAEIDAIQKAVRKLNSDLAILRKSTLYVCRFRVSTGWGLAKPCAGCIACVVAFGIGHIVYSENGVGEYTLL
jgi:tRNA(Arg) A34 adenosine deaminase TadA